MRWIAHTTEVGQLSLYIRMNDPRTVKTPTRTHSLLLIPKPTLPALRFPPNAWAGAEVESPLSRSFASASDSRRLGLDVFPESDWYVVLEVRGAAREGAERGVRLAGGGE